jgi:hypothetical protein
MRNGLPLEEPDDRLGMTQDQWDIFKRFTFGYGDQDKNGVDLSLIRENLKLTPTERLKKMQTMVNSLRTMRRPNARFQF